MQKEGDEEGAGGGKWAAPVMDEAAERIESVKAGVLSAVAGSIAMTPIAVLVSSSWYPSDAFDAQWELAHDGLAVMLGLFGLVYRYGLPSWPLPVSSTSPFPLPRVFHSTQCTSCVVGFLTVCVLLGLLTAVRQDPNPQLKQGVVGAFVITRALAMLQASDECTALPLSCGPPLG